MHAPLAGIRVVEVATFVAAPSAGALLADLGADVIKLEVPEGELVRHTRPRMLGFDSRFDGAPPFEMDNRGKRSLTLDLKRPESLDALHRVIDGADVLLTNMLPGRRKRFGIDDESLLARLPRLIYASLTGYGTRGAEADTPSFDYAAFWARTGFMDLTRAPGATPAFLRPGTGDHAAGLSLVCGILSALRVRDQTGRGQVVDVSLLQLGFYIQGNDLAQTLVTGQSPPPHDRSAPRNPLWNLYATAGDRWLMLVMIDSQKYWRDFCTVLGRPELCDDERFVGPVERYRNSGALVAILDAAFAERTLPEWEEYLEGKPIIWSPMKEMAETLNDPQAREMGYFETVDHPRLGSFETVGPPFQLSDAEVIGNRPAPDLGADTRAVLNEAGLSDAEIEAATARARR
jgi:crotonobetainyl-CoA:carnitine CoA-transferase CaiB-like acyl-CoA transferase